MEVETTAVMQIISATESDSVIAARQMIADGGILVYPTDTLYGFGVDPTNGAAIERLSTIKGRGGPFSIIVGSVEQLAKILLVPTSAVTNIRLMLPGPYAIIGKPLTPSAWPPQLLGPDQTLSVRFGNHGWLRDLFSDWDGTVVTTSVNRAGEPPTQNPTTIATQFGGEVDLLVDAGSLPDSTGSTMVDITTEPWQLIRKGDGAWPL